MARNTYVLLALLAMGSATTTAQETEEASGTRAPTHEGEPAEPAPAGETEPETVTINCVGDLPTFTRRLTRAARQHELAIPTRRAIRGAFRRLDVNGDGAIDAGEAIHVGNTDPLDQGSTAVSERVHEIVFNDEGALRPVRERDVLAGGPSWLGDKVWRTTCYVRGSIPLE